MTVPSCRQRGQSTSRNPKLSDRKQKSGHGFYMGARHQDRLADWLSVLNSTSTSTSRTTSMRRVTGSPGLCSRQATGNAILMGDSKGKRQLENSRSVDMRVRSEEWNLLAGSGERVTASSRVRDCTVLIAWKQRCWHLLEQCRRSCPSYRWFWGQTVMWYVWWSWKDFNHSKYSG
jgi:hypothetical protein